MEPETPTPAATETAAEQTAQVTTSTQADPVSFDFWSAENLLDLALTYGLPAIGALIVLFIAYIVSAWLARVVSGSLRRAKVDETLAIFFGKIARWVILACAFIAILGNFGVSTASFAAVIAAVGFGIGLAMEGTLSNISAGVMLLVFRPFKVDDYISVSGEDGSVVEIDLFTTTLNTLDNRRVILPNKVVFGTTMQNFSANDLRRVDVAVGVTYKADIDETRKVLTEAVESVNNYGSERGPEVYLVELGTSSVDWSLRVWTSPEYYWDVREETTAAAKKALDAAGISIPFPQMDVHLDKGELEG